MSNIKTRLRKIEATVQDDTLTEVDLEILLSCLPRDYAQEVKKELLRLVQKKIAEGRNSIPHIGGPIRSRGEALEEILGILPVEIAERARTKIEISHHRRRS